MEIIHDEPVGGRHLPDKIRSTCEKVSHGRRANYANRGHGDYDHGRNPLALVVSHPGRLMRACVWASLRLATNRTRSWRCRSCCSSRRLATECVVFHAAAAAGRGTAPLGGLGRSVLFSSPAAPGHSNLGNPWRSDFHIPSSRTGTPWVGSALTSQWPRPFGSEVSMSDPQDERIVETTVRARQGVTGHNVRYVLAFSTGGVIVAFIIIYFLFSH
jgi:hypothetical protein